jgi:rhodanese-related sulfurtransferase
MIREALVISLLTLLAAAGTHFFHPRAPSWHLSEEPVGEHETSMAEIATKWKGDVFWIDARVDEQYTAEHVPGAISLNEQNFDSALFDHIETLQDLKKPMIIYCGGEKCEASTKIRQALVERLPLENVFVLKGGWQAWKQAAR